MEALKKACNSSTFKNFDQIIPGEYPVTDFSFVETRFGRKLKVNTAEFFCYLPARFLEFINTDEHIEELNKVTQVMVFKGKDAQWKNRLILDLQPAADSQWKFNELLSMPIIGIAD